MKTIEVGIIGGGAAGFFCAIEIASSNPKYNVIILEKSDKVLAKVKISGGGRCNISNACFDNNELVKNYPRGSKELKSVFYNFNPSDTIKWFESRGVKLKTEKDNRIFPESEKSETIINLFLNESKRYNIEIIKNYLVKEINKTKEGFKINPKSKFTLNFKKLVIATGGNSNIEFYKMFKNLGHTIIPPAPSLFTFKIENHPLKGLEGISVGKVRVKVLNTKFSCEDAILITHWGFSGPSILTLSSFTARELFKLNYNFKIEINWIPDIKDIKNSLIYMKEKYRNQKISSHSHFNLPIRLWKKLIEQVGINEDLKWTGASKEKLYGLEKILTENIYLVNDKTKYKEEFVTAGGISLKEINFKNMESKICKDLYFAGEVLDIDGITGGFNFQSCWSTAYIAARAITKRDSPKKD